MIGSGNRAAGSLQGRYEMGSYPNPHFNVSNQFIPKNFHEVLKWSRFIMLKSPTVAEVLRKMATYPITELRFPTPKEALKEKYEEIFEAIKFIEKASDAGFDYNAYGNSVTSIYFPVDRFLKCPSCSTSYSIRKALEGKYALWKRYKFFGECPHCATKVEWKREDVKSTDHKRINIVKWKPDDLSMNCNPITGENEIYYKMPQSIRAKIAMGDPHFISSVPWGFVDAVRMNKEFKFDNDQIHHMKSLNMGDMIEGFGVPPLVSHYSTTFYMECLRKANEAVALEHMNPMRMIYPQQGSPSADPITTMSLGNFTANVKGNLQKFKKDPNHVMISPVPMGVGHFGGSGKALLVTQELQFAEEQQLMAMGVSRELLSGTTNWTSSTVGLRLLENNMNQYVRKLAAYTKWITRQISSYLGIECIDVDFVPFELTDNDSVKQMYLELHSRSLISGKTLLEMFDVDPDKEQERIMKDQIEMAENAIKMKKDVAIAEYMATNDDQSDNEEDSGYSEYKEDVLRTAQKIVGAKDENVQREMIMKLMHEDRAKYAQVMALIQSNQPEEEDGETPNNVTAKAAKGTSNGSV